MLNAWRLKALHILLFGLEALIWVPEGVSATNRTVWTRARKHNLLEQTRALWYHGFDNYMRHGFPADELRPLSCKGRGPDWDNPDNFGNNDVAANVSLTLIDVLDTLVVLNDTLRFEEAVRNVIAFVSFDVDTKPQVFEITIRALGGLLSAHIFAADSQSPCHLPWYRGELLDLAKDLGERLLPAFRTSTGIPYARTNLRYGVPRGETAESCTAGAGSLIIEFGILSRLTGDDRFEKAAAKSFFALWNRRTDVNLVGNTINIWTGTWTNPLVTGIGAGIDSFYEYALKWYIISGDAEYWDVFQDSYAAIMRYARSVDGFWFQHVHINTGEYAYATIDSLSSFWPGLQVLAGDVENAIKTHLVYWNLWKRHSGLPEVFDVNFSKAVAWQYPLRPEFIESTYYLYRATRDSFYLDIGERVLHDLTSRSKVPCGLTGILDLSNNTRDDRMESFVLSETLKYLALLFDEENPLHSGDSNMVFSTEGHLLHLNTSHLKPMTEIRRKLRGTEHLECPAYQSPITRSNRTSSQLTTGVRDRVDFEWARQLMTASLSDDNQRLMEVGDNLFWDSSGRCEVPKAAIYSYEFILSAEGDAVQEDPSPGADKLQRIPDGFLITNASGIRAQVVTRKDGQGYDVTRLGPYAVRAGQKVYVTDQDTIYGAWGGKHDDSKKRERRREGNLRFQLTESDPLVVALGGRPDIESQLSATAFTALFGADMFSTHKPALRIHGSDIRLVRDTSNMQGCRPYSEGSFYDNEVAVVRRGDCTFVEKLRHAAAAGAAGVIVISSDELGINPTSDASDDVTNLEHAPLAVLLKSTGEQLLEMMDLADRYESEVLVIVEHHEQPAASLPSPKDPTNLSNITDGQKLWLSGKPIVNMIILA